MCPPRFREHGSPWVHILGHAGCLSPAICGRASPLPRPRQVSEAVGLCLKLTQTRKNPKGSLLKRLSQGSPRSHGRPQPDRKIMCTEASAVFP